MPFDEPSKRKIKTWAGIGALHGLLAWLIMLALPLNVLFDSPFKSWLGGLFTGLWSIAIPIIAGIIIYVIGSYIRIWIKRRQRRDWLRMFETAFIGTVLFWIYTLFTGFAFDIWALIGVAMLTFVGTNLTWFVLNIFKRKVPED